MMSHTFKFIRDYYHKGDYIYQHSTAKFNPGITVLIGCNGSGKTSLINQLREKLISNHIPYTNYNNYIDGGFQAITNSLFNGDMNSFLPASVSSEGENISQNVAKVFKDIGSMIRTYKNADEMWILLDGVDSGLSIDLIDDFVKGLNFVLKDNRDKDIYVIVSANQYELTINNPCFSVMDMKYIDINSYDDFKKIILETRRYKNQRYSQSKQT